MKTDRQTGIASLVLVVFFAGVLTYSLTSRIGVATAAASSALYHATRNSSSSETASLASFTSTATPSPARTSSSTITPTTEPFHATPLNDLWNGSHQGLQGGLYEGGSNSIPADHALVGMARAQTIQPLDSNGNPDQLGKIVLLSIGMSNASREWCGDGNRPPNPSPSCTNLAGSNGSFMGRATASGLVNTSTLLILKGAQSGKSASFWDNPTDAPYDYVRDYSLTPSGVTENQVQVLWINEASITIAQTFLPVPTALAYQEVAEFANILRSAKIRYPNVKFAFFSSPIYLGYSLEPSIVEPGSYETGLAVKMLIQSQIDQMRSGETMPHFLGGDLNYNTVAPWVAWGPYYWADGANPRSDGLTWVPSDYLEDMVHPNSNGIAKAGQEIFEYFLESPYTRCWFTWIGCQQAASRIFFIPFVMK